MNGHFESGVMEASEAGASLDKQSDNDSPNKHVAKRFKVKKPLIFLAHS